LSKAKEIRAGDAYCTGRAGKKWHRGRLAKGGGNQGLVRVRSPKPEQKFRGVKSWGLITETLFCSYYKWTTETKGKSGKVVFRGRSVY